MSDHPTPKLRGVPVTLADGKVYTVPSLNFRQLEEHEERLTRTLRPVPTMSAAERADLLVLSHAALSRNYPEMTLDAMRELVDLEAAGELVFAISAVNQLQEQLKRAGGSG